MAASDWRTKPRPRKPRPADPLTKLKAYIRQANWSSLHELEVQARGKQRYAQNRESELGKARSREVERRRRCIMAYGGPICACCGETTYEFLTIDHINGGGNKHAEARRDKGQHANLYTHLIAEGFPPGYQVLCYNCNCAKGNYGVCPHQQLKAANAG